MIARLSYLDEIMRLRSLLERCRKSGIVHADDLARCFLCSTENCHCDACTRVEEQCRLRNDVAKELSLRCLVTGNLVGTDTRPLSKPCPCSSCSPPQEAR